MTQAEKLLRTLKTINGKTRLFGIFKPNVEGPKLSYDDTIQAISYGLQSLTAARNIDQAVSDNIASVSHVSSAIFFSSNKQFKIPLSFTHM